MIKRDFHGWLVQDAVREVHNIIGESRNRSKIENAEFITGHGVIKVELIELLKQYDLTPEVQWGNTGVVVVTIE